MRVAWGFRIIAGAVAVGALLALAWGRPSLPRTPRLDELAMIPVVAAAFLLLGTVLRMWDTLSQVERRGEYLPRTSREEMRRLRLFFTPLERFSHAYATDAELEYLRAAQSWFLLSLGAGFALLHAILSMLDA